MLEFLGMPVAASAHAADVDRILEMLHWLMLVLFVGWSLFFVVVLVRFRRKANPRANYAGAKGSLSKYVEAGVAIAEVALLIGWAIPAWARRVNDVPPDDRALVVRVVGEQYAWNVHYAGPDGRFGRTDPKLVAPDNPLGLDKRDPAAKDDIITINQLNVPVDRPVVVRLTSKDVIHSFGVYELRVKQDAIPGMEFPVWFVPTRTGEYEITCSQLCGLGHFRMRGFVNVQTAEAYRQWVDEQEKELTQ